MASQGVNTVLRDSLNPRVYFCAVNRFLLLWLLKLQPELDSVLASLIDRFVPTVDLPASKRFC